MSQAQQRWTSRSVKVAVVVLWGGAVISWVDSGFARAADEALLRAPLLGSSFSLIAMLAFPLWLGLLALALFFAKDEPPTLTKSLQRFAAVPASEARERSLGLLLAAVGSVLGLVFVARSALTLFESEIAPAGSSAFLVLFVSSLAWVAFAGLRVLARIAARIYRGPLPPPDVALISAVGVVVAGVCLLAAIGETSGAGGAFRMFGVLRRTELDLRAPALLAVWLFVGYWAPGHLRLRARWVLIVALLIPLVLAIVGYRAWNEETAIGIRRGAPLGRLILPLAWRLTDRDHDGVSAAFGGSDCDDHNPAIYPGAPDVPGNGVDEDCSGTDDLPLPPESKETPAPDADAALKTGFPEKLNVVLITVDTLRVDLGYMGYERPISPNIDRLAQKSVVFERAYSLASYTGKSIGPLLIGRYPSETHRNYGHFNRFGSEDTFIQERLQKAKIRTLSVQGHWYFKADSGLGRGFDVLDLSAAPRVAQGEGDRTVNSDKISDAAIAELQKLGNDAPQFFLWVHYLDPHAEYVPHAEFEFGKNQRALYDGEIAFTDLHVGRLLSFIEQSSFAANTVLILTSDHGEAFGEHGMVRHGFELWEELVRVPLLIYVPGVSARHESTPRSAIDLIPTIYDLFRQPAPPPNTFSGHSLLPDLILPSGYQPKARPILVDMCEGPYNDERQAFIQDDKKLITSNGRPLGLYDLRDDAAEKKNLLSNTELKSTVVEQMKAFKRTLEIVNVPRR